ncbi:MAG TPA: ERAP1-like C-terminal domain-containing protein, partial [Desulfosarcina sp.]|nr:ERAP1-like C-terminal domain-containing protein [Desulfosarcina sp.]
LMDGALSSIGLEPSTQESQTAAMLRDQLFVHGAFMGSADILGFLAHQFESFLNGSPIAPDIFRGVVTTGAIRGGQEVLDALLRRFETSGAEHERMTLAGALGAFSQWPLLLQALDYSLEKVPDRIRFMPLVAATGNPAVLDRLWPWFEANLPRLESMHPLLFERVVAAFVPLPGMQEADRTRSFCRQLQQKHPRLKDTIALSLERLEVNDRFRRANSSEIEKST